MRCRRFSACVFCLALLLAFAASALAGPVVGEKAPPLTVETLLQAPEDASARLEDLAGSVVIVEFWATWCGPCIAAIPHLNELADRFADEDVRFIAITNEKRDVVEPFLARREMRSWIALDPQGESLKAYGVTGIPRTFIIGRDGTLLADTHPTALKAEHIERALRGEPIGIDPPRRAEVVAVGGGREARYGPSYIPGEFPGVGFEQNPLPTPLAQVIVRPALQPDAGAFAGSMADSRNTWIGHEAGHIVRGAFAQAHGVPQTRVDVRAPLPEGVFDVALFAPAGGASYRRLVEAGIGAAFGVEARVEEREVDVLVLRAGDDAAQRLEPSASTGGSSTSTRTDAGRTTLIAINRPVSDIATYLETSLKTPVIDESGIAGGYDYEFHMAEDPAAAREALARLGLKLENDRRTLKFVVIEPENRGGP